MTYEKDDRSSNKTSTVALHQNHAIAVIEMSLKQIPKSRSKAQYS